MVARIVRGLLRQQGVANGFGHSLHAGRARRLVRAILIVIVSTAAVGCASNNDADADSAKTFEAFPLYWAGETFEGFDVAVIDGVFDGTERVSIIYGSCEPSGTFEQSCRPPVSIQITRLCFHIDAVTLPPRPRQVRGAPVGGQDGAPVLLTRNTQVKVYQGEGTDRGISLRALRALRSLNAVEPVCFSKRPDPRPATRSHQWEPALSGVRSLWDGAAERRRWRTRRAAAAACRAAS